MNSAATMYRDFKLLKEALYLAEASCTASTGHARSYALSEFGQAMRKAPEWAWVTACRVQYGNFDSASRGEIGKHAILHEVLRNVHGRIDPAQEREITEWRDKLGAKYARAVSEVESKPQRPNAKLTKLIIQAALVGRRI